MTETERLVNVKFEIFESDGSLIDTLDGPGDLGDWFSGPLSPYLACILPIPFEEFNSVDTKNEFFKVRRTWLDEKLEEIPGSEEEIVMIQDHTLEFSKTLAVKYNCSHLYFIEWDGPRFIVLHDLENDDEITFAHNDYD